LSSETGRRESVDDVAVALSSVSKAARELKASEYEGFVRASTTKRITVQPDGTRGFSLMNERALFVRIIRDGKMGVSHTNDLRPRRIRDCVRVAYDLSSYGHKSGSEVGFPSAKRSYPRIGSLFDSRIAELGFGEADDMMGAMLNAAVESEKHVQITGRGLFATRYSTGVCNSNGIDVRQDFTDFHVSCASVSGKGRSITPECISTASSRKKDIDVEEVGRICSFISGRSSVQAPSATGERDVVFSPRSVGSPDSGLLTIMMSRALSGMEVVNDSTFLADREGDKIASDTLTVRDAPVTPGRTGSRPFDDEGVPTAERVLIRGGVLESFMWDHQFGSRRGLGSTGNAVRDMSTGLVSPAPLFLEVAPGSGDMDDLVSEVDDGYLVWDCQGAHTSSPETGAFSFVASPGLRVKKGDIVGGVQGVMLSGNIIDLMRNVTRVGADQADFYNSFMPSILFRDVKITTG